MYSFLTKVKSFIPCLLFVFIALIFMYISLLREDLQEAQDQVLLWKNSALHAQKSMDTMRIHQEKLEKTIHVSLIEKQKFQEENTKKLQALKDLQKNNINIQEWAKNEIPKEIQILIKQKTL